MQNMHRNFDNGLCIYTFLRKMKIWRRKNERKKQKGSIAAQCPSTQFSGLWPITSPLPCTLGRYLVSLDSWNLLDLPRDTHSPFHPQPQLRTPHAFQGQICKTSYTRAVAVIQKNPKPCGPRQPEKQEEPSPRFNLLPKKKTAAMAKRLIPSLNRVLVEKLLQPKKSAGGILLPETTKQVRGTQISLVSLRFRWWALAPSARDWCGIFCESGLRGVGFGFVDLGRGSSEDSCCGGRGECIGSCLGESCIGLSRWRVVIIRNWSDWMGV